MNYTGDASTAWIETTPEDEVSAGSYGSPDFNHAANASEARKFFEYLFALIPKGSAVRFVSGL